MKIQKPLKRVLYSSDWTSMTTQPLINNTNQILLKSADKLAAIRLTYHGHLVDSVVFDAEKDSTPDVLTDCLLGNYSNDLFQLSIVNIEQVAKEKWVENYNTIKCNRGHVLQTRDQIYTKKSVCALCNQRVYLNSESPTYMRCDFDGCNYDVCRRPDCHPALVKEMQGV